MPTNAISARRTCSKRLPHHGLIADHGRGFGIVRQQWRGQIKRFTTQFLRQLTRQG